MLAEEFVCYLYPDAKISIKNYYSNKYPREPRLTSNPELTVYPFCRPLRLLSSV